MTIVTTAQSARALLQNFEIENTISPIEDQSTIVNDENIAA